jgi:hypothetical protein
MQGFSVFFHTISVLNLGFHTGSGELIAIPFAPTIAAGIRS